MRRWSKGSTYSSHLLWLVEATLPVSAGGSSKRPNRWREDGSEPQVEALSERQETDPIRRKRRAAAPQQGPPYSSACRIILHGSHIVMKTDILRRHAAD